MSEASVLKRKLAPPLAKALADCAIEALLCKTMPRDADTLCGLDLVVDDVSFAATDKAALIGGIAEAELVFRLDNEKAASGLCIVSPELLAGLIEVQLYGYVTKGDVPERKPTRTDGIVVAALVDAWLASAEGVAAREDMEPMPFAGFIRQDGVLDQRNAALLIEPGSYSKMTIQLTLGDNAKTGTLCLAWPERAKQTPTSERMSKRMERHLSQLEAPMRVVLTRLSLPMERVRDLKAEDVIDVPLEALASVKLEGTDGTPIATGRLGQANGQRAVRLNSESGSSGPAALAAPEATARGAPPDMAGLSRMPDMASAPEVAGLPELPSLDDALPAVPDLPDLPDLPDIGELTDLPEAGELPDLPDLPDLP